MPAVIVIGKLPVGVEDAVEILRVTETGLPATGEIEEEGWNSQAAPEGRPEQDSATPPVKLPTAPTWKEAAPLVAPGVAVMLGGDGVLNMKSALCRVSAKS